MKNIIEKIKYKMAFTLIEVLVSITIISIITIGIMPLLTEGIKTVYNASEKSENLFKSEGEMQYKLADNIVFKEVEVPIKFKNKSDVNNIKGGLVESENLYSFITSIPTIKINPSVLVEGYRPKNIEIFGNNTHFNNTDTDFKIIDKNNNTVNNYSTNIKSNNSISLSLNSGLSNSQNEYIIKITTERDIGLEEIEPEVARAKLQINPPNFMAGGNNGEILASKDGKYWTSKNSPTNKQFSDSVRINNQFIFSTKSGVIYSLVDDQGWKKTLVDLKSINNLLKEEGNGENTIWAIGEKGVSQNYPVYNSQDGSNWEPFNLLDSNQANIPDEILAAEISTENNKMFFAGEGVVISYKKNDNSISIIDLNEKLEENINNSDITITDIVYGSENFIFIGHKKDGNRIILRYNNQNNKWNLVQDNPQPLINTVYWSQEYEKFLAVGNSGTIMSSNSGLNWNNKNSSLINNDIDLINIVTFTYNNKSLLLLSGKDSYDNYLYYSDNENDFTDINKIEGISTFDNLFTFINRF